MTAVEVKPLLLKRTAKPKKPINANPTSPTTVITVNMPTKLVHQIDQLVGEGQFMNRSECIRAAVTHLILVFLEKKEEIFLKGEGN